MVLNELVKVHSTVGTANNIIGFDPRGVNNSGPDLSCVTGGQETYGLYSGFDTTLDVTDKRSYSEIYAKAAAFGEFCTKAHSSANDTAKYANTIATAGDMLRYIESLAKSHGQDPKKSQLWYYGGSYGSVLGTTYASLFPDRVGRLIVDGIADAEDYYRGEWSAGLVDADEAFRYFFQTCFDAGRNGTCPFWAESPAAIERRLDAIIEDITLHPIPFFNEVPAIFTVTDLKMFLAQVPYDPLLLYINLAHTLVQLEQRNPNPLAVALGLGKGSSDCITEKKPAFFEPPRFIACTDANGRYNLSAYDAWVGHANRMAKQSKYMGEWWATITGVQCHKLDIRAPDTQVFNGYPNASHTSNPLLFISTTVDPVTPLRAAEKTVKRFGGAGLLVQNSVGHVSISAHSNCTSAWVQHYLATGQLPPNGTRCEPDSVPFKN
ncbi:hypothetical protein CC86DRAFT_278852 [Ophiobolus disseminans]|uniref:Peptidase S33 tripeptidyl aminopeptidase-like C-terminal domain-containing protein n=1 Tax=Ophiobolus disseminans TaxID=1469910 RepID=A0A6A7AKV4_9PLEO|nr:hypothetical protein CC86DRAFT_278852 [Ophiobolus disseminans]